MLFYQILAYTIHGKIEKIHTKIMYLELEYQLWYLSTILNIL